MARSATKGMGIKLTPDLTELDRKMAVLQSSLMPHVRDVVMGPGTAVVLHETQRFAPQPAGEQNILVTGAIIEPWQRNKGRGGRLGRAVVHAGRSVGATDVAGGKVGTGQGGRFEKRGRQKYIVQALADQRWRAPRVKVGKRVASLRMSWGSWKKMARSTGFTYYQKQGFGKRIRQSTLPFNRDWPYAAEKGGTWIVTPRPRTHTGFEVPLTPEPKVYARKMMKTVKPHRYAERGQRALNRWMAARGGQIAAGRALKQAGFRTK